MIIFLIQNAYTRSTPWTLYRLNAFSGVSVSEQLIIKVGYDDVRAVCVLGVFLALRCGVCACVRATSMQRCVAACNPRLATTRATMY